jgi:hypothetical protein
VPTPGLNGTVKIQLLDSRGMPIGEPWEMLITDGVIDIQVPAGDGWLTIESGLRDEDRESRGEGSSEGAE